MDEAQYTKLLDQAYLELPEVLYKKERFNVPEVKGRLIKSRTIISNFREIAKHLSRAEDHFHKFMLREVGVRGDLNERGELILHSRFQPGMLNKGVQNYFKKYVECPNCKSPDTTLNGVSLTCKACGHEERVPQL